MLTHFNVLNDSALPWVAFLDGFGGISSLWHNQLVEFKEHYNVLVIDINGKALDEDSLHLEVICTAICKILDGEELARAHFIGISLGTVVLRYFSGKFPDRVSSMILAGAIVQLNWRIRVLLRAKQVGLRLFSTSALFTFFTYLLMPKRSHKVSRTFLMDGSMDWDDRQFEKWSEFTSRLRPVLDYLNTDVSNIPTLFVMGEEDHFFLPHVKKLASQEPGILLFIIQDCGHLVSLEQPELFNKMVIGYLVGTAKSEESRVKVSVSGSPLAGNEVLTVNSNNASKSMDSDFM